MENCHFSHGNVTMNQAIGILQGIGATPFWENLFLYSCEEEYMPSLIFSDKMKARHFPLTKHFIGNFYAINNGRKFGRCIYEIYSEEVEVKIEHHDDHVTFLNLDITIKKGTLLYKLFGKRNSFPFSIVRMPYIERNIPQYILY